MHSSAPTLTRFVSQLVDLAVVSIALLVLYFGAVSQNMPDGAEHFLTARVTVRNVFLCGAFLLVWHFLFRCAGLYEVNRLSRRQEISRTIAASFAGSLLAMIFPVFSATGAFSFSLVLIFWLVVTVILVGLRLAVFALRFWTHQEPHVLIVGTGSISQRARERIRRGPYPSHVLGYVDCRESDAIPAELGRHFLGTIDQLDQILMHGIVDHVLVALPVKSCYNAIQQVIETCEKVGVSMSLPSEVFEFTLARRLVLNGANGASFLHAAVAANDERVVVKRFLDVAISSLAILFLAPVMLLLALLVKATSRGPVLFVQERYGLHKRRFRMLKFRTMVQDAEALQASLEARNEVAGPAFKLRNDPRITRIGRVLRRTSLDELPQLFNVLVGDMSLVGPRPLPVRDVSRFSESWLMRRFSVRPGLTCLWQISGRSNTTFDEWIRLDLKYIDTWSLSLDFLILARTVSVVLKGEGAL